MEKVNAIENIKKELPKPKLIKEYLDTYVIGQDEAKKTLATAAYNHYKRVLFDSHEITNENLSHLNNVKIDKSNVLMIGGTGTGKTYLIKTLADVVGVPCYIGDCTNLTEGGYVGNDVETLLTGLLHEANFDVEAAEFGIVVCDEIDKLAKKSPGVSLTKDVGGEGVQQSLLKILEGAKVGTPAQGGRKHPEESLIEVDTSKILFIGLGAFPGIDEIIARRTNKNRLGFKTIEDKDDDIMNNEDITPEDLKEYGFIPEFIGRFPIITKTNELSDEELLHILTKPKNNIISQYQKLLAFDNVELKFTDEALMEIVKIAKPMKTGARSLRSIVEKILSEVMYEYSDKENETVTIDKDFVNTVYFCNKKKTGS